jgi:hypothetical protein
MIPTDTDTRLGPGQTPEARSGSRALPGMALLAGVDRGKSAINFAPDAVPPAACIPSLRSVGERDDPDDAYPSLRVLVQLMLDGSVPAVA